MFVLMISLIGGLVLGFEGVPNRFPTRKLEEFDRHVASEDG